MNFFFISEEEFTMNSNEHRLEKSLTQQLYELPDLDKDELNMVSSPYKLQLCSQKSIASKSETNSNSQKSGQFIGDFHNDGVSGDFDSITYSHSREMMNVTRAIFCLFLLNQLFIVFNIIFVFIPGLQTKVWSLSI